MPVLTPQDKPYAFFGTCLGAITAYEAIHAIQRHGTGPPPLAFFPAAVSPPHVYAQAVAQLYVAPGEAAVPEEGLMAGVLQKLRGWRDLPRELIMQVGSGDAGVKHDGGQGQCLLHDAQGLEAESLDKDCARQQGG